MPGTLGAHIPTRAPEIPARASNVEGRPETPDPGSKGEEMATTTARPAALDPQQDGAHEARADRGRPPRASALHAAHARHRGARAHPLPPGQGAGQLLRRPRPGGRVGGLGVRARPARPRLHPAPRPGRAPRPRRDARAGARPDDGPRRRSRPAARTATCTSATASSAASGMVSMLPDMALVACGLALAFQMRREPRVAMTWFGDGSTANGQWHEAMNVAGVRRCRWCSCSRTTSSPTRLPTTLEFAVDPVRARRPPTASRA